MDFRSLNRVVVFDAEPLPNIDALFAKLGKAKFFNKIDLCKGYWQIPMAHPRQRTTPQGQFQWTVMPFGWRRERFSVG